MLKDTLTWLRAQVHVNMTVLKDMRHDCMFKDTLT